MHRPTILQIRLDPLLSSDCAEALAAAGYEVIDVASRQQCQRLVASLDSPLVIVDDVERLTAWNIADIPALSAIVLTTTESEARAVRALRLGALDYFRWPDERASLLARVQALMPVRVVDDAMARAFVGESAAIRRVQHQIARAAATDCNVLVVGETGTGKELAANLLHSLSARAQKPFVAVNCAAIPDTLLESELFGHDRGAFTGAVETCEGKLRQADKGTLFLDEVGDMSLLAQAKVLRAFECRTVTRVGGRTALPTDVRIVAATNVDLAAAAKEGRFRPDLFYRLNVTEVNIPPLRERADDIALLVDHYARQCNQRFHRRGQAFSKDVLQGLVGYSWPGNVRELRNVVEATFVNSSARWLSWTDLPLQFRRYFPPPLERAVRGERALLLEALADSRGNKTRAAELLHCSRMSIYRMLAKYGVHSE